MELDSNIIKTDMKRYTTIAGNSILVRYSASTHAGGRGRKRKPKENITPEAVAKVNRKNRERNLTAKLNASFAPGDLWLTTTYEFAEENGITRSRERCMKDYSSFIKNLQRRAKKAGIEIKAISSFGIGKRSGRPHHHIVISNVPTQWLTEAWTHGAVHIEVLKGYSYHRIAAYMLKNAEETADGKIHKAYHSTRNITNPVTKVEELKKAELPDPECIKAPKGYSVDRDTVHVYEHPIFEIDCMEYIAVSLEKEPRIKRWNKGKTIKDEPQYSAYKPKQIELWEEWEEQNDE